ncbi:MAG: NHL repeat-containing protein [Actinomycetota bacterium]
MNPKKILSVAIGAMLAFSGCSSSSKNHSSGPSKSPRASRNPLLCPTEEGLTNCGLGPTNPPPIAVGNYKLSTFAGNGTRGTTDGPAASASFIEPTGIAVRSDGSILVVDTGASRIRMVTADGTVSTFAGTTRGYADGPLATAKFAYPRGIAVGSDGTIYVADTGNDVIRAISGGTVSTYAGIPKKAGKRNGPAASATFNAPYGIAIDQSGSIYVTDFGGNDVRLITVSKTVRLLAGSGKRGFKNGKASVAKFASPAGVAVDTNADVFVSDTAGNRIRKIANGVVSTFAGGSTVGFKDGRGTSALFNAPYGLAIDQVNNLYVTEYANNSVRKIDPNRVVTTLVTSSGTAVARHGHTITQGLDLPIGIAIASDGSIYISDAGNDVVRLLKKG